MSYPVPSLRFYGTKLLRVEQSKPGTGRSALIHFIRCAALPRTPGSALPFGGI
jgi:hypothetical protein